MGDTIKDYIAEKKKKLEELIKSRPKANCSDTYSSASDVKREEQIEELEDQIKELHAQM